MRILRRHPKRFAALAAAFIAVASSTFGLTHRSSAYDVISQLGLDQYAASISGAGIVLWPTTAQAPISETQAIQTCGTSFPTPLPKAAIYAHVHITGFGWGPVGALDQDAWVFAIDPVAMQGPAGVERANLPPVGMPLDNHHDAWVLWFEGIRFPGGHQCFGFGRGPG